MTTPELKRFFQNNLYREQASLFSTKSSGEVASYRSEKKTESTELKEHRKAVACSHPFGHRAMTVDTADRVNCCFLNISLICQESCSRILFFTQTI